jgi:hypothetical protein
MSWPILLGMDNQTQLQHHTIPVGIHCSTLLQRYRHRPFKWRAGLKGRKENRSLPFI